MEQKYWKLQTFPFYGFAAGNYAEEKLWSHSPWGGLAPPPAALKEKNKSNVYIKISQRRISFLSTRQVIIFYENPNPKANDSLTGLALTQAVVQGSGATKKHHCWTSGMFLLHLKSSRSRSMHNTASPQACKTAHKMNPSSVKEQPAVSANARHLHFAQETEGSKNMFECLKKINSHREEWAGSLWLPWVCSLLSEGSRLDLAHPGVFSKPWADLNCSATWLGLSVPIGQAWARPRMRQCEAARLLYLGAPGDRNTSASYSLWWSHLAWGGSKV